MKRYEEVPRTSLTPRMPLIIRVDGRAFHTYTRRFKRQVESPWSPYIRDGMTAAAEALLREISGVKIAYLQSDEINILVTDYDSLSSEPWFGKVAQKICSISAAIATAAFNQTMLALEMGEQRVTVDRAGAHVFKIEFPRLATFDSRCFVVPRSDVCNYFVWRQRDCEKNSVSMLAQKYFSSKQLHGKNGGQKQDMLMEQHGVNWNDCDVWQRRGWCVARRTVEAVVATDTVGVKGEPPPSAAIGVTYGRTIVEPDWDIPVFTKDRWYIDQHVDLEEAARQRTADGLMDAILEANAGEPETPAEPISPERLAGILEAAEEDLE